jgi:hypothetical protein
MGRDHPQWEMYAASKHGVRALLKQTGALPGNVSGPRCQDCHMADGNHEVRTAWGFFGVRLPLPDDPQWRADQATILRALGVLDERGGTTLRFDTLRDLDMARVTRADFDTERARMSSACSACHSPRFVATELARGDTMIRASDREFAAAIRIVESLYADGILQRPPGRTSDIPDLLTIRDAPSPIEQRLYDMYLVHRMHSFQGVFHASPQYALWDGWSGVVRDREAIEAMAVEMRRQAQTGR